MKNPYDDLFEPEEIEVGRGVAWLAVFLFLFVCVAPPLWRNVVALSDGDVSTAWELLFKKDASISVADHLGEAESRIEDAPFTGPPRQFLQAFFTATFGAGNTKTVVGRDRWLFFRPALDAVTQSGPLQPPPLGAASDPALKRWRPALPAIKKFAADLKSRGIELILVPVPVKPMVYPEHLTGEQTGQAVNHRDASEFYGELATSGVIVGDFLANVFALKADESPVFLKQDTHWTPRAMAVVAEKVAELIRSRPWFAESETERSRYSSRELARSARGDLVENLDLPAASSLFRPEPTVLEAVIDSQTGGRPTSDRQSPIVLLGDSFVNIFDDPNLGFGIGSDGEVGGAAGDPIGAGFGQHLAAGLGMPLDVIAINGQAATQVRQDFARRFDDEVRAKKAVVWLIAARDLFLTAKPAMANGVNWGDVTWNPKQSPVRSGTPDAGVLLVEARLLQRATIPDPRTLPYSDSTYETLWEVTRLLEGDPGLIEGGQLFVKPWAFRDKKLVVTASLETGKIYRFHATPMESLPHVRSAQTQALEDTPLLGEFFGKSFKAIDSDG